ncbi:hypothetical protein AMQ83_30110 [Paenibacillus riograndensis]|nr:hypothetical protein AMQ83_30110 [Paenibacillus riograndensis]
MMMHLMSDAKELHEQLLHFLQQMTPKLNEKLNLLHFVQQYPLEKLFLTQNPQINCTKYNRT